MPGRRNKKGGGARYMGMGGRYKGMGARYMGMGRFGKRRRLMNHRMMRRGMRGGGFFKTLGKIASTVAPILPMLV